MRAAEPRGRTCRSGCSRAPRLLDFLSRFPADAKSGMPDSVEIPAPVNATMRMEEATQILRTLDRLRHFVSLYSTWHDDVRPVHCLARDDRVRNLMRVIRSAVYHRERGVRKPGVRRALACVPRRSVPAPAHVGNHSRHPQVQTIAWTTTSRGTGPVIPAARHDHVRHGDRDEFVTFLGWTD